MDLASLSGMELRALQDQVKHELQKREVEEVAQAREKILAIAQSIGKPLDEILASAGKVKLAPVVIRFQHPDNPELKWSGRGRKPNWINDWEVSKSIDELRV
jgi:DNA-binding protein H-NS